MLIKTEQILPKPEWAPEERDKQAKPYCIPQLTELGDLRTITLGASPVTEFESGGGLGAEYIYIP